MKTISLKFAGCAALLALGLNAGAGVAKIGDQEYDTLGDAVTAADSGNLIQIVVAGTYTMPDLPKNICISGAVDGVVLNCTKGDSISSIPYGATLKNMTMNFGTGKSYNGFQHAGPINIDRCTLNGQFFSYAEMNFTYCTFNAPGTTAAGGSVEYSMWTYAGNVTYDHCTFNSVGKAILCYNEQNNPKDYGPGPWVITVKNCDFHNPSGNMKKAAVFVKTEVPDGSGAFKREPPKPLNFDIRISSCTIDGTWPKTMSDRPADEQVEGYAIGGDGLWATEGRVFEDNTKITFNGLEVYPHEEKPEIKIEEVTENESKGITQDVADQINNNTAAKEIVKSGVNDALANIDPEGEAVVKVELKKVEKAAETPTLTFEVAPYVGNTMVEDVNQKLNGKKVTVVLPLTKDFTISAIVTHAGDPDRLLPVLGLPNSPYVRLETTHFSEFIATPNSQKVSSTEVDAKTVLGIKRVKEMAKSVDTAAAVPWLGAAGANCKVSELITTGLAAGDTIKVYDLATKGYFVWVVDKDGKTWVKVSGAPASQPEAHEYTLARGRAFWYMKDGENESAEYTQVGTYSTDQILTATDKGGAAAPVHNLLINPKWAAFNVSQSLVDGATDGDQIVIVDTKARYEFKLVEGVGKWGTIQPTETKIVIGGVERTVRGPDQFVPVTEDLVIPQGKAFWYISKGGEPTVKW